MSSEGGIWTSQCALDSDSFCELLAQARAPGGDRPLLARMVRVLTAALAPTRGAAAPTSEMELVIHKDDEIIESVCVAELAVRLALLLGLLATC